MRSLVPAAVALMAALPLPAETGGAASWRVEAETGRTTGGVVIARDPETPDSPAWATGFAKPGDALELRVRAPAAGLYRVDLHYAADAAKRVPLSVNGNLQGSRLLPAAKRFTSHAYGRVYLEDGDNVIRVGTDWGYIDLDAITLTADPTPAPRAEPSGPANPKAAPAARRLHRRLAEAWGVKTFAGQHDANPRACPRLARVAEASGGAAPALLGLDLLYYSPAWGRPEGDGAIETARDWALKRGGIVTLSWHWFSPLGGGERIWDSFSTGKTTFDLTRALDEAAPEHAALLRDLDAVAEKLAILRDAGVPVLWRPVHEAQGGWFWWGSKGAEPAKALYRLMFDRFTRVHGLDNLLWVWTSTDDDDATTWYPGDEYVDFIAADLYAPAGERGDFFAVYDRLESLFGGRKPIALGECGAMPEASPRARWLWFLVWDDLIERPGFNPPEAIARRYADPDVVSLR